MRSDLSSTEENAGDPESPVKFAVIVALASGGLVATYLLGMSSMDGTLKTGVFLIMLVAFLAISMSLHIRRTRRPTPTDPSELVLEERLIVLDEAREYFAGSLRTADALRLIVDRLQPLLAFEGVTLIATDADRERPRVVATQGNVVTSSPDHEALIRESLHTGQIEIAPDTPSIAMPLIRESVPVAVIRFDFDAKFDMARVPIALLESIASRIGPLILSSLSFERSHNQALTDSITELPNERAFFQVLETQIGESKRDPDLRPLSILALDIKGFDDINQRFGHAAGDRVLEFVAKAMRDNLRQMDFFARSGADEFLIVTPTAPAEIANEIIARLQTTVFGRKLAVTESDTVELDLSFGAASLGPDGETPEALLKAARLRKEESKSPFPGKVLWFPQEFVN